MIDGSRRLTEQKEQKAPENVHSFFTIKHAVLFKWMEQFNPQLPSLPASSNPPGVYLIMCSTRSSATRNMDRGRDKTRFPSILISNTKQGFNVKNMEVMITNLCKNVQHREQ
jgi:hypothetical protein